MLGWMMIFAIFALTGTLLTVSGPTAPSASVMLVTILFSVLFCLGILTRIIRGRV